MAAPLVVFCDFDGTMTERDMIISVCEKFCPPRWRQVVDDIVQKKLTVKDGVVDLFAMIPSSQKDEIIAYAHSIVEWRAGLKDFMLFCKENGIAFVVCSGGVDFFLKPLIEPFKPWISHVYCNIADFSGPTIQLLHPLACETEGTCKVKVMEQFPGAIRLLIGDSISDIHGARNAHQVFARDRLRTYLDEESILYHPFETFHDVLAAFKQFRGPIHARSV